jgi:DNA-binding MarR family transcriptional regulator
MGERLMVHPTSVTNIVDRLEAQGLVRRTAHPTDRRTTLCEITDEGRKVGAEATAVVVGIDVGIAGLTDRESDQLTRLLAKMRRASGDFT